MNLTIDKQNRFHYIDGFRGIASVLVVLHHATGSGIKDFLTAHGMPNLGELYSYITSGGVSLFFVISGLVLLRPYLRGERTLSAPLYFQKRFTRIYPPYFAALLLSAAIIWFINTYPTWYNEKGIYVIFSVKETLKEALFFNLDGVYYNLAWWSLGIEGLFYVSVPILLLFKPNLTNISNKKLITTVSIVIIATVGLQFLMDAYTPSLYSLNHVVLNIGKAVDYPLCFFMGMLLATNDFSKKFAYIFITLGVVFYVLHVYHTPAVHIGLGFFWGGLLILGARIEKFKNFLKSPIMLWVGERSYSIFLVHMSLFYFVNNMAARVTTHRGLEYALITRGIGIPLSFFLAMLLFHFVERKFARGLVTDKQFWPWQAKAI